MHIRRRNVLTTTLDAQQKADLGLPQDGYAVVLANPPFPGRLDKDRIVDDVKVGTTTATEILFFKSMMDSLKPDGRCGVIVPEGVLFRSTGAHKELRRQLLENNRVEAVLVMPGGVFQPHSGAKTSVLLFRKGGTTERVMFLHADNDGYKLDARHDAPIDEDDLPALVECFNAWDELAQEWNRFIHERHEETRRKEEGRLREPSCTSWTKNWWFATADEMKAKDYSLSAGRYLPLSQVQAEHRDPRELLDELAAIEAEILAEVEALQVSLSETRLCAAMRHVNSVMSVPKIEYQSK